MTTNDQMLFASEVVVGSGLLSRDDSHLPFLPFAHSFAPIIKAAWLGSGLTMIFAESVDKLVDNASETSPTILSAVPRVYEKAFNSVIAGGMANPGLSGALFRMAMREFELYAKAKQEGRQYSSLAFSLARRLVFPKVKDKLSKRFGGRIAKFVSGGAPLALEGALKTGSELISQVVVIGDKRKYVSVLVTVVEAEAKKVSGTASYAEAARHPAVKQRIQEAIDKLNQTLPSYETIKRF